MRYRFCLICVLVLVLMMGCAPQQGAEQALTGYLTALQSQQFDQAADYLSTFSLEALGQTRSDASAYYAQMDEAGHKITAFEILEKKTISATTVAVLVRSTTQKSGEGAITIEAWMPLSLEDGAWKVNWGNLIDEVTFKESQPVTSSSLTIQLVKLVRYTDATTLVFDVRNDGDVLVYWGKTGAKIGRLTVDKDQVFDAFVGEDSGSGVSTPAEIKPGAEAKGVTLTFAGAAWTVPEMVELMNFSSQTPAGQVSMPVQPWGYQFKFK